MLLYILESRDDYLSGTLFRFVSLFNGTRGAWAIKEKAILQGDAHQKIIEAIHPELSTLLNEKGGDA